MYVLFKTVKEVTWDRSKTQIFYKLISQGICVQKPHRPRIDYLSTLTSWFFLSYIWPACKIYQKMEVLWFIILLKAQLYRVPRSARTKLNKCTLIQNVLDNFYIKRNSIQFPFRQYKAWRWLSLRYCAM